MVAARPGQSLGAASTEIQVPLSVTEGARNVARILSDRYRERTGLSVKRGHRYRTIAIVGAGVAGLGCARTLVRAGIDDVQVVELEDTAGGNSRGHRIAGLRVRSISGAPARPLQVIVRTALLCLFLPAMFWDRDGRGLHDKAAGTVLVRL